MVLCQHMAIYGFMSTYGSMKTHKGQNRMTLTLGSQRFTHSAGKSGGLRSRMERCRGYVSVFENIPEELILKSNFPMKVAATLLNG